MTDAAICCEPGLLIVIDPMCRGAVSVPIHQLLLERPVSLVAAPIMTTHSEGHHAVKLSKVFGADVSPSVWRGFKDHFLLVKRANIARGVAVWKEASYRSVELRLCLTGAPAEYVREEAAQNSEWVQDDEKILERPGATIRHNRSH